MEIEAAEGSAAVNGDAAGLTIAPAPPAPITLGLRSLRARAMHGSFWTIVGYLGAQVLRMGSSIVLSRLIAPEVTGLIAMVNVFLVGLEMFSDIGILPSIIQNKRGDEPDFLNTAWTIQVGRGFMLWIVSCLGAWPVAKFFEEPSLILLIPVMGFTAVFSGFNSPSIAWLNRRLELGKLTIIGLADQVVNVVAIIVWAWFSPTPWALVGGALIAHVFYLTASHFLVRGQPVRFRWNPEDAKALFQFGRWVFFSTALTFFAVQSDRIMCGKLLGKATLGIYSYALPIAMVAPQFIKRISNQVAFPVLSEIVRTRPERLDFQLRRLRLALIGCSLLILLPLMFFGRQLIHLLYDARWWDAGWMVQILAAGALGGLVNSTYGCALLALGRTFQISMLLSIQLIFLIGGAIAGYWFMGEKGFIIGLATVEWLNYPATAIVMARYKLWHPEIDLGLFALSAIAIGAAFWLL